MSELESFKGNLPSQGFVVDGQIVPATSGNSLALPSADLDVPSPSYQDAVDNLGAMLETPLHDGWQPFYPGKRRLIGKNEPGKPVHTMLGTVNPIQPEGIILERAVYRPTPELANINTDPRYPTERRVHRLWPTDTDYRNMTDGVVVVERIADKNDRKHLLIMPGTVQVERTVYNEQYLKPRAAYLISQMGTRATATLTDYDAGSSRAWPLTDGDIKTLASNLPAIFDKELFTVDDAEGVSKILVPVEFRSGKFMYVDKTALIEHARRKQFKFVDVEWTKPKL